MVSELEALELFANALENAVAVLKQSLARIQKPERQWSWQPSKIKWSQDKGQKGAYERYPAKDQKAESTEDYRNMLQDLKDHKGALNREGFFYWVFTDQATVGRRMKKD